MRSFINKTTLRIFYLQIIVAIFSFSSQAQTWTLAGPDDGNQPNYYTTYYTSMAPDKAGGIYMAYGEYIIASPTSWIMKASVRRWNGSDWQQVGQSGFSASLVASLQIAVSPAIVPYVVYKDYGNGNKAMVKMYDGTSWVNVGSGTISTGGVNYTSIAIDRTGFVYVAYADSLASYKATVKKWDGSTWQTIGIPSFTPASILSTKLVINGQGTPYLLVRRNGTGGPFAEVYKFSGSAWVSLGNPAGSTAEPRSADIAVSVSDTAFVAFTDITNDSRMAVRKYTGTAWTAVGSPGISPSNTADVQIRIDSINGPYVACMSDTVTSAIGPVYPMVRRFNGTSWVRVSSDSFETGNLSSSLSLAIDTGHVPYFLATDVAYQAKTLLRKLNGTTWNLLGTSDGFSGGPTTAGTASAASPDGKTGYCITINPLWYLCNGIPRVYKYDASGWTVIGQSGVSGWNGTATAIAVHPDGQPWIIVADSATRNSTVWRYNGTSWINTFSNDTANFGDITFDDAGNAYTAYIPYSGPAFVRKYTAGIGWTTLNGAPGGFSLALSSLRIRVSRTGVLYAAYTSGNYYLAVNSYNGSAWTAVGASFNSATSIVSQAGSLAFDSSNALYLAYLTNNAGAIRVKKFDPGTSLWNDFIPATSFTQKGVGPRIQFAQNGSLYLSYTDQSVSATGSITVQRLAGNTWQPIGSSSFSKTFAGGPDLMLLNNRLLTTFSDGSAFAYKNDCGLPVLISQQPANQPVCVGSTATFSTTASGAISYRWQMKDGNGWANISDNIVYSGTTTGNLSISNVTLAQNSLRVRCVYTNACLSTMISEEARLLVDTPGLSAPILTISADRSVACAGALVRFMATAINPGIFHTFEWRINGFPVAGANDSIFSTAVLNQGDTVTCQLTRTSACGAPPVSATSNSISIDIISVSAPTIVISVAPGTTVNPGQSVTFTAAITNGGLTPQIQWFRNNVAIPGATALTYTTNTVAEGDIMFARITRSDTCAATNSATSASLIMHVSTGLENSHGKSRIKLFPQPAHGYVILSFPENMRSESYQLTIWSITGHIVLQNVLKRTINGTWIYKLSIPAGLPAGIYRLSIQGEDIALNKTLAVE